MLVNIVVLVFLETIRNNSVSVLYDKIYISTLQLLQVSVSAPLRTCSYWDWHHVGNPMNCGLWWYNSPICMEQPFLVVNNSKIGFKSKLCSTWKMIYYPFVKNLDYLVNMHKNLVKYVFGCGEIILKQMYLVVMLLQGARHYTLVLIGTSRRSKVTKTGRATITYILPIE